MSNETPGADLQQAISQALERADPSDPGDEDAGRKTNQAFSTYQEMNYALKRNPFLVKMPWDVIWEEPAAEMALDGRMWEGWTPGAPLPQELVEHIIEKIPALV